jgi:hypothetical protein
MKKLFGVKYSHFKELKKKGYSLDSLFILSLIDDGIDIEEIAKEDSSVNLLLNTLTRKNLIGNDFKLTQLGVELLEFCGTRGEKLKLSKAKDDDFEKWWKVFPTSNYFTHKGKTFQGTQSKRIKEMECRSLFNKYVTTGEFTAEEIIGATEFHIGMTLDLSIKTGKNEVSYISNSHTYLLQKKFQPFIKGWKDKEVFNKPVTKGVVDI